MSEFRSDKSTLRFFTKLDDQTDLVHDIPVTNLVIAIDMGEPGGDHSVTSVRMPDGTIRLVDGDLEDTQDTDRADSLAYLLQSGKDGKA